MHACDIIAQALELGTSGECLVPPPEPEAWERIGLPASVLTRTVEQVERQFSEVLRTILPDATSWAN